jgi:hypothetical protein
VPVPTGLVLAFLNWDRTNRGLAVIRSTKRLAYNHSRSHFIFHSHRFLPLRVSIATMTTKKRMKTKSPRKPHLCKIHGKPIRPDRWRSGHRNTGCADCYRTRKMPPPGKRLCQEHGLPILRQRWWSGYRTKGCPECFKVPKPKNRLCRIHKKPIVPSMWIRGRHSTGCSTCFRSRPGYAAAKARSRARARVRLRKAKPKKSGLRKRKR